MITDIVSVTNAPGGMDAAMDAVRQVIRGQALSRREALHLELLTEEMTSLLYAVTGELRGSFWVERENGRYALHLTAYTPMDFQKRQQLLTTATDGKNAGRRGVLGKLQDVFERYVQRFRTENVPGYYAQELMHQAGALDNGEEGWSLTGYRNTLTGSGESWNELERSVLANLADEVSVSIRGDKVELTVVKKPEAAGNR